jgi:16S rRNA (cytosine1402-N4)-methyltransferase
MGFVQHTPVMVESVANFLLSNPEGIIVDATLGLGGHAEHLLEKGGSGLKVIGVDRDRSALEEAKRRLEPFGERVTYVCGNFRSIGKLILGLKCDGFLLDLGLSSYQLSDLKRGFSYMQDGPLDMSMGEDGRSVRGLLSTGGEKEIGRILREYGEERRYRVIARELARVGEEGGLISTRKLRAAVERVVPAKGLMSSLSRVFQALRIWANDELDSLREFLPQTVEFLNPGGRLVAISYHSLEDRIVKRFMKQEEDGCVCPPDFPECRCGRTVTLKVLTRRPVLPSPVELEGNPRARSAKLRAAERV